MCEGQLDRRFPHQESDPFPPLEEISPWRDLQLKMESAVVLMKGKNKNKGIKQNVLAKCQDPQGFISQIAYNQAFLFQAGDRRT